MKLRTRITLFSMVLIAILVLVISNSTLYFLKALVLSEIESSQRTLVENLRKSVEESQETRDDILAYNMAQSLEKTVKGIAYAVVVKPKEGFVINEREVFNQAIGLPPKPIVENKSELEAKKGKAQKEAKPAPPQENPRESFIKNQLAQPEKYKILITPEGRRIISYGIKVNNDAAYLGFFQDKVEENIQESVRQIKTIVVYVALVALLIGTIFSVIFSISLTGPIKKLAAGAQAIGEGNLETQIEIHRKDELGILADEFNIMAVKLKELDQLKDAFVSSVSHELRSPLTAISGYVELLTMKPIHELNPEKTKKALGIILESTARLTQFVNDILDVAKIKAGKMEIHRTPFDVKATAESVMSLFQPLFDKKKIKAAVRVAEKFPTIIADGEKVRQVITNLLSNAYKFTPDGGQITLEAAATSDLVTLSVRDTGIGIPRQHQGLIFGKFQQVPGSRQKLAGAKGTGLGLAIAKGIVEAHNGKIWFESEENKGTTFFFTLPIKAETGKQVIESKHLA